MRVKWLHLSDIHFNFKNFNSNELRKDFIEKVNNFGSEEPFTHIFLTGDILNRNSDAHDDTIGFIELLIKAVNVDKNNVFLVPGNHDHDRNQTIQHTKSIFEKADENDRASETESITSETKQNLLNSFGNFDDIYSKVFGGNYYLQKTEPHQIVKCGSLNIIKLNTAWLDIDSDYNESLMIGSFQLQNLLSAHEELLRMRNGINIAVGHHPINDLMPLERNRLLQLFKRYNIGLYFCGHSHKPDILYSVEHDVLQFTCPGGYNNAYSEGGFIWGILDTDCDFYKAEFYAWNNGNWSVESRLPGTNDAGEYYMNTQRFRNNSNISVFDLKTYNGHLTEKQILKAVGTTNVHTIKYDDPSPFDWNSAEKAIEDLAAKISLSVENNYTTHLFPLTHIPLLLKLGFELQKNSKLIIHQNDRDADRWVYKNSETFSGVSISSKDIGAAKELVVSISTSMLVNRDQINRSITFSKYDYIEFRTLNIELGQPLYNNDVELVAKGITDNLNSIASDYNSIHIFAAIPAGLAVEIGRRLLQSIHKNIHTYEFKSGQYKHAIVINPVAALTNHEPIQNFDMYTTDFSQLLVAGNIACSTLNEAAFENDSYLPFPTSLLSSGEHFVLETKGESMKDAGINDGDYVVVRRQETADNRQIVVARVGNETTLKRLIKDNKRRKIILHPENPEFDDIEMDDVDIQGVAVKIIKNVR